MNTTHTKGTTGQEEKLMATQLLDALSIRDYFAAKAMQALLTRQPDPRPAPQWFQPGHEVNDAKFCYSIADAMLRARDPANGAANQGEQR